MHNFKELNVWQKARAFSKSIYSLTSDFPKVEQFGVVSQLRRASVSISSNIAEGSGRGSDKDMCRFLDIALGSAFEVESLLYLALDLGYINQDDFDNLNSQVLEIGKMLSSLNQCLVKRQPSNI
jgi:S23 ribosomal protein.